MEEKKEKPIKKEKTEEKQKGPVKQEKREELIRILSTDIPGSKNIYSGLTRIKGVSFALSGAVCKITGIDKKRKVISLKQEEIDNLSEIIKNPKLPEFMKNRRKDFETGDTKHLSVTELDLTKDFDIKRLKKIKSYKGVRHSFGLPVRGQRTKSHFRKKGRNKAVGVKKKK
jgi:small subunit ribosomal protein S13